VRVLATGHQELQLEAMEEPTKAMEMSTICQLNDPFLCKNFLDLFMDIDIHVFTYIRKCTCMIYIYT